MSVVATIDHLSLFSSPPSSCKLPPAAVSTSLASVETAVIQAAGSPSPPEQSSDADSQPHFRHSGWARQRARVFAALREAIGCGWTLQAFHDCGDGMWILRNRTDASKYKAVANHCKSRWCVPCQATRAYVIRNRVAAHLDNHPVRFLTLTLRHGQNTLDDCLDRLYSAFRTLRSKPIWKNRVTGGVAFLEVKRGHGDGLWHPHLHCLIQGRYIPQADLAQTWLAVTGDSSHVDIRLVHSRDAVIRYVTDYATKTASIQPHAPHYPGDYDRPTPHESLVEAIRALRGRRTIIGFGTWRTWRLLAAESDPEWELVASLAELEIQADRGDDHASAIIDALRYANDDPEGVFRVLDTT